MVVLGVPVFSFLFACLLVSPAQAQDSGTIFKPGKGFVNEQHFSGIGIRFNGNKPKANHYLESIVENLNAGIVQAKLNGSSSYPLLTTDLPPSITPVFSLSNKRSRLEITDRSGPMRVVELEYGAEYSLDEIPCSPNDHPIIANTVYSGPLIVQGATRFMTHANLDYLVGYKAGNAIFAYALGGVSLDAIRAHQRPMYDAMSVSVQGGVTTDPNLTPKLRYVGGLEFATEYQIGIGGIVGDQNVLMAGYGGKFSGGNGLRDMTSTTGGWSDESSVPYGNNPIAGIFLRFTNPNIQATGSFQRRNYDHSNWAACSVLIRVNKSLALEASARAMSEGRGTFTDDAPVLLAPSTQVSIGARYVIPNLHLIPKVRTALRKVKADLRSDK